MGTGKAILGVGLVGGALALIARGVKTKAASGWGSRITGIGYDTPLKTVFVGPTWPESARGNGELYLLTLPNNNPLATVRVIPRDSGVTDFQLQTIAGPPIQIFIDGQPVATVNAMFTNHQLPE